MKIHSHLPQPRLISKTVTTPTESWWSSDGRHLAFFDTTGLYYWLRASQTPQSVSLLPPPAGFTSHRAVAQTAGNVLLRLAESLILPLNVSNYGETLQAMYDTAERVFQVDLLNHSISLGEEGEGRPALQGCRTERQQGRRSHRFTVFSKLNSDQQL